MTASYISVISPITLLAETATNNADIKGTVSVKEEKSEVLISAEEGGTVVLGEASIEIPEGALKERHKDKHHAHPQGGGHRRIPLQRDCAPRRLQVPARGNEV
ncbi:MAG: hypothetical protein L6V90_08250 [Treponema succinifaciens]|nr:MAG: hypothetical protein L6V90_08250 [Treponema succinifaciens]